ncbi:MAG: FtsX-like permease family protein, partial [Candidatus Hodarchaeota archaeon]
MTNFRKRENDNSKTRVSSNFKPKKSYFNKFIPRYVIKAIKHNWKRSITTILAIIIAVSLTTSLIMWIETSPRIAISAAMEERAYELRIRNLISNRENPLLDEVQSYINNSEPLVEASYLIQPSVFLFNLNNRLYNLSLSNPPENESDFFISEDYRSGAFLIEEGFLDHLSQQFSFSSSDDNLTTFNNGVAISKRLLLGIELATNQSFKRGDTIDFAIATRIADPERGEDFVYFYQPILFTNITINAIFDRKVQRNLLYPYFFPESLGDGIFISRNLFNQSSIKKMEEQIINPYLFARIDRKSVASMSIYTVTREIEALSFRIEAKSTWLLVDIYTDEIDQILSNYENSQVIILFLFIPLLISASIFFTTVTSYLLEQRKNEIELLRVKGNTFRNIMTLFTVEFVILSGIGVFIGVISGLIITLAISACEYFLVFNIQKIPPNFITTLFMSWQTWIFSALLIELVYIFIAIQKIRGMLLKLQNEKSSTDKYQTRKRLSKRRTDIFIFGMTIALFLLIVQSDVVNRLSIDYHLMGLYLAFATILWFLLSNRLTQYSGDFLPRITRITKFLFKAKNKVISMNIVRKRPQILNILTLIILTVSLGIFSAYYAQTIDANTQKNLNYLIGSDFKVFTEETDVNYSKELEKIQGVSTALSITQTTGSIGSYLVTIVGVNPESYLLGSYWSKESIVDGGPMENMLNNLSANGTSGIIINDFLASTL